MCAVDIMLFQHDIMHTCTCTLAHLHTYTCTVTHLHMHSHTLAHLHTCTCTVTHLHMHTCTCTLAHLHMHSHTLAHLHMHNYTLAHTQSHTCTCTITHLHTYTLAHAQLHTRTHNIQEHRYTSCKKDIYNGEHMVSVNMAERRDRAIQLINDAAREAVNILLTETDRTHEQNTSSAPVNSTSTISGASSTPSNASRPNVNRRLTELPKLFPIFRTSTNSSSSLRWKPYKIKNTWTHQFLCLSDKDQETIPSREEKYRLNNVGLGERKVVFNDKRGSWEHVKSVIEKDFPKLKDVNGAFEIVRSSGNRRPLELVAIPPMGYTVPFLKEILGQAIGYIRPLQKKLGSYTCFQGKCTQLIFIEKLVD